MNIYFEQQKRDYNLINIAEAIAQSPITLQGGDPVLEEYLDSLKESLQDIDVISVVNADSTRRYHSNHDLIGSVYDGTKPDFSNNNKSYTANDKGHSGTQRRAYAAIYDGEGNYQGFVIAVMLISNIREQTLQTMLVFLLITLAAAGTEKLRWIFWKTPCNASFLTCVKIRKNGSPATKLLARLGLPV